MELSRRKLLVAAGAAAAAVPAAHAAQDPSLSDNVPKKWDRTVKLLIVGAGGAGLTAAVSAAQNGLTDTLILEKMAYIGGNTAISGGGMNAEIHKIMATDRLAVRLVLFRAAAV